MKLDLLIQQVKGSVPLTPLQTLTFTFNENEQMRNNNRPCRKRGCHSVYTHLSWRKQRKVKMEAIDLI